MGPSVRARERSDPILKVQVQLVNGPDLGVGPGSDLNRTSIYASSVNMYYILSIEKNSVFFTCRFQEMSEF